MNWFCLWITFQKIVIAWNERHRAYAVEMFFKTSECVTLTQQFFRIHFSLDRYDTVSDRKSMLLWVKIFRTTDSALKRKPTGRPRNVSTPENVQRVRQSVLQSPTRSSRKHAAALRLSDRSVQRTLHADLKFHPLSNGLSRASRARFAKSNAMLWGYLAKCPCRCSSSH